ncbi:MAG: hypothetical protein IJJ50_07930 [Lachnospiraceae bacterium]|nr:hypothetical protein [Lachnospiraceae bacterium]
MRQCQNCGAMIDDDRARVCPTCGRPMAPVKGDFSQRVNQTIGEIQNTPDYSNYYHPADVERNKGISVLSYLGLLLLIPYLARKDSPYARFHVNQGLVLFLTEAVYNLVIRVIRGIFGHTILSPIVSILGILDIVFVVLMIIGIVNAASGRAKELPVIGKIRILQ